MPTKKIFRVRWMDLFCVLGASALCVWLVITVLNAWVARGY